MRVSNGRGFRKFRAGILKFLLIHHLKNSENLFDAPYICYGFMYVLMLAAMIAFFVILPGLELIYDKALYKAKEKRNCTVFAMQQDTTKIV